MGGNQQQLQSRSQSPTPTTDTTPGLSTDPQDLLGNEAINQCIDANTIPWEDTGNILGTPPVKSRQRSPNHNIVEDQANYLAWRAKAQTALASLQGKVAEGGPLIDSEGEVTDARYYFAQVYTYVTENELTFAAQGTYNYPTYVMASVCYFEKIYSDNYAAFDAQQAAYEELADGAADDSVAAAVARGVARGLHPVENHWQEVFDAGTELDTDDIEDAAAALLSSMKAHIRFDLPRAEAWVFSSLYGSNPCATIQDFRPDFFAMAGVFENASESMAATMLERTDWEESILTRMAMAWGPRMLQDWGMGFMPIFGQGVDMGVERVDTWRRAELLNQNGAGVDPYANGLDSGNVTQGDHLTPLSTATADSGLQPTMSADTEPLDDDQVNDNLAAMTDAQVQALSATQKARYLEGLLTGATVDGDEADVLRILRLCGGQLVTVVNAVEAWDLGYKLDGDEHDTLRGILRRGYYGQVDQNTALAIIRRCMDGETAEWEEQMVADILVARSAGDGRRLLIRIGRVYDDSILSAMATGMEQGGGDASAFDDNFFEKGLNKVLWQLDGEDDSRVRAIYGDA